MNNDTGQLSRMTHSMFFKGCANHVREVGIKQAITKVLGKALFELPLRTVNGMIIFATIQASMGLMGDEPLAVVRNKFFPEADATPPQVGEDGAKAAPTTSGPTPASIPVSVSEHKAEPKPGTPEPATGPRSF